MKIRTKKDAEELLNKMPNKDDSWGSQPNCIVIPNDPDIAMMNGGSTKICKNGDDLSQYSWGQNWRDQGHSSISKKKAIDKIYRNRKKVSEFLDMEERGLN